ncbi:uncharacterized protein LOC126212699 [Schistocerca nitens]|uniref:uncharacterized protein LOC126212699 n=1 Tax=Schistocerca nitens TaxID=7011 RepID=UPI00211943E1|nr:uncharacterized protein LOC126212699 [Schistocerca nitens]
MALIVNYVPEDPSAVSECANKIKEEPKERGEQDRAEAAVAPFAEDFVLEQDTLNIKKEKDLEEASLSNSEFTNNTKREAEVTFDEDGAENCNLQDTFSILEFTNNVKQEAEITIDDNGVEDYVLEDLLPVSEWTNNIKSEPELTIDEDGMENNDMVSTEYASNTTWSSQIMEKFPSTSRGNVLQKLIHGKPETDPETSTPTLSCGIRPQQIISKKDSSLNTDKNTSPQGQLAATITGRLRTRARLLAHSNWLRQETLRLVFPGKQRPQPTAPLTGKPYIDPAATANDSSRREVQYAVFQLLVDDSPHHSRLPGCSAENLATSLGETELHWTLE